VLGIWPHRLESKSYNYIDFGILVNYYFKKLIKINAKYIQRGENDFLNNNANIYFVYNDYELSAIMLICTAIIVTIT
jgi:hypothetical protein